MKTLAALIIACGALAAAQARPLIIQESARLTNPNAAVYPDFANHIAMDRNEAPISLSRFESHYPDADDENFTSVWLFRRTNGTWSPVRELTTDRDIFYIWPNGLSMRNGIAALALNPLQVFEKVNGDWVKS